MACEFHLIHSARCCKYPVSNFHLSRYFFPPQNHIKLNSLFNKKKKKPHYSLTKMKTIHFPLP